MPSEMVSAPIAFPRSAATCSTTEVELDLDVTTKWTPVRCAIAALAAVSTELVVGTWAAPAAPAMADSIASVDATHAETPIERPRRRDTNGLINEVYSRDHSHGERHPAARDRVGARHLRYGFAFLGLLGLYTGLLSLSEGAQEIK